MNGSVRRATVENWLARIIATGVGLVGVVFLAVFPLTRIATARERADIDRALTPLVSMPLDRLQTPAGRILDLTWGRPKSTA
jgi:hypothetical protein